VTLSSDATLSAVAASTVSFSGVIKDGSNGAKGITKTGAGTVVLSGSNTYTGSTILNDGNLQVGLSGSGKTGTGNVTVDGSGAVLSGSGTVDGSSTSVILGVVKPGDSGGTLTGTLNTKTLIFTPASSTTVAELQILGSTAGSNLSADKINITGDLTLNSFSNLFVNGSGYTAAVGDAFTIIDWSGLLTLNSFSTGSNMRTGNNDDANEENLDLPNISGIGLWDITNFSSGGALTLTVVAVPEPTRGMLMLLGSMLLIFRRRRING
jgi:autotransporter-associated beta strand protein